MKKTYVLMALCFLLSLTLHGQDDNALGRLKQYVGNVATFNRLFPQEKVFVHTDNTGYFVGETIWFEAYVLRADQAAPTDISGVLYVELVDPFGEVTQTHKIKLENGRGGGQIPLDKLRADGFYELRAYTRYMTNWDAEGVFSRVIPIFAQPESEGDYDNLHITQAFVHSRSEATLQADSARMQRLVNLKTEPKPQVRFYPEGGHLIKGLPTRVAFEVFDEDSVITRAEGQLTGSDGQRLATVATLHEGRGVLDYVAGTEAAQLELNINGRRHRFALPEAEDEGCVMNVDTSRPEAVTTRMAASPTLQGALMGLTRMHNGRVTYFDTLRLDDGWTTIDFDTDKLDAGIHQLTVFDTEGRVWAERLFFVHPDSLTATSRLNASFADKTIAPYKNMTLRLEGEPGSQLSVAVTDADATTNGSQSSLATWLLLTSDLKGYVARPDYYLESQDETHRRDTDLLMMVQGWRRYDWTMMAGRAPFEKRQPIEDHLYLDGRVLPRQLWGNGLFASKKKKAQAADVGQLELKATLYNDRGEVLRGEFETDSLGYYAFELPDCHGDWTLMLSTKRDDKLQDYRVTINRRFSPESKNYMPGETLLTQPDGRLHTFNAMTKDYEEALQVNDGSTRLGTAVVTTKRNPFKLKSPRRSWEVSRRTADKKSQFHYDMATEADYYLDQGLPVPSLEQWLLEKKAFAHEYRVRRRPIGWVIGEAQYADFTLPSATTLRLDDNGNYGTATHAEPVTAANERAALASESLTQDNGGQMKAYGADEYGDSTGLNTSLGNEIDLYREVYVSLNHNETRYIAPNERGAIAHLDPFFVFAYENLSLPVKAKGTRTTNYRAFQKRQTYESPNYRQQARERDFRRTLYWAGEVTLDADGRAELDFCNNSTCRRLYISVEGLTPDGRPVRY
ncbi:MAG: hypothetical protein ACI3YA_04780 [Alloprevotella sp.]